MRCPVCGTQNEPDSRFCGGCGARVNGTESRLAPTEKINSDAPLAVPPTGSIPPGMRQAPSGLALDGQGRHVSAPPEMPAPNGGIPLTKPGTGAVPARPSGLLAQHPGHPVAPGMSTRPGAGPSIPPGTSAQRATGGSPPATGSGQQPRPSAQRSASLGVSQPRTRWGVVIVLLLLDFGLAGSGGWMLWQGLRSDEVSQATPAPAPAATPAPKAAPPAAVAPVKTGAVTAPPAEIAPPPPPVVVAETKTAEEQANEKAKLDAIANDSSPTTTPSPPTSAPPATNQHPGADLNSHIDAIRTAPPTPVAKKKPKPRKASTPAKAVDGPVDPYGDKQ